MEVLNHQQINHKIIRLSYEILENNLDQNQIILAGINNNGYKFAQLLFDSLSNISDKKVILSRIQLNPAYPTDHPITTDMSSQQLQNKTIIIVDDVANTGRTVFYACKVYMEVLPYKIEVAVLVDRKHKLFPIKVDYVGLSLATTLQESIKADLSHPDALAVTLN
ncbi:MAG: phosphoribosyltransferase [Saprospiraceae bacterium]|nr:phosphoribosyltransferase [Saprospiraceae bacterium]MBK8671352.1 phosphoribosyltransferase [Saprospiraceae bacterium]